MSESVERKYGVGLWIFGRLSDRFVADGYKPAKSLDERLRMASEVPLVKGVELAYPSDLQELPLEDLRRKLSALNLTISAIDIDLFSKPKWQKGSITSKDESLRREALEIVENGVECARKLGASNLVLWLGQDGHDYLFADHREKWRLLIDSLKEISSFLKAETLYLEYKHKEPRTHSLISNVGKTLHIINRVGSDRLGVTIDTGHALMADENLAESVYIIGDSGVPLMLHLNDAYGYWDDDMILGSINLLKFVEFFYALREVGYSGWYDLDIYPYREDPVKACDQSLRMVDYMVRLVERHHDELHEAIKSDDPHRALDAVWKLLLKDFQ